MVRMKMGKTGKLLVFTAVLNCGGKDKAPPLGDGAEDTAGAASTLPPEDPNPDGTPPEDPPSDTADSSDTAGATDTAGPSDGPDPEVDPDAVGDSMADAAELRSVGAWNWDVPLAEEAIDHVGDVDVYRVDLLADVQVLLVAQQVDGVDLHLRVMDMDERVLGASDVMPHRAWGDDPGLWLHAREEGPFYIEVTGSDSDSPAGEYRLLGVRVDEEDAEPNNTQLDAADRVSLGEQVFRTSRVLPDGYQEFSGVMHAGEDVDLWVFDPVESAVLSWSMWEMASLAFDAQFTLYDSLMQPIAWSNAPTYQDQGGWYKDVGILYAVTGGERYYLGVKNARPPSGAGTLYVGVQAAEEPAQLEVEPNDTRDAPHWISLTDSSSHIGYANTTVFGMLDGADNFDVIALPTEDVSDQYVSIHLQTGLVGSGLSARLEVSTDVAGEVVVGGGAVDSTGELSLTDVLVPADADGLFIVVEAFGRTNPESGNQFFLGIEKFTVPLHE